MQLPDLIILPFEQSFDDIMTEAYPLMENGVDFSILIHDCIDVIGQYLGVTATAHDFHGIPYVRFEDSFDVYCHVAYGGRDNMDHNDYDNEMEFFYEAYGNIVEHLYLRTHQHFESLSDQYGSSLMPNLRFNGFLDKDLIFKTRG